MLRVLWHCMQIVFHKNFKKQYKKLPNKVQRKFSERLDIFLDNDNHPLLNIHQLQGEGRPLISMNVTGDYRALFVREKESVTFHRIGRHSELY